MSWSTRAAAYVHKYLFEQRYRRREAHWKPSLRSAGGAGSKIILTGFLNEVLGIGHAAARTYNALASAGYDVIGEDLRPLHYGLLRRPPVDMPIADAGVWLIHANPPEARIALFRHRSEQWQNLYRIGYWAWESSMAPAAWADLAQWFHEIWVPSAFVRDALTETFHATGLGAASAKLRVMPHPVKSEGHTTRRAAGRTGRIKALCMFDPRSSYNRKNPMGAVTAWLAAFPQPSPTASLTIKLTNAGPDPEFVRLLNAISARSDIVILSETLGNSEMADLIASHDILISLHRGEGFGLALSDAMAAGLCVIATGWSGNMEFMTPENSVLVPARLVAAESLYNGPMAQWADPDLAYAAEQLRSLAANPDQIARFGQNAQNTILGMDIPWHREQLKMLPFNEYLAGLGSIQPPSDDFAT